MTRYQELQNAIRESNKGLHYLKQDHETFHVESLCAEVDQLRARVAELEAHTVNLLPFANMLLRNEQPMAAYADTLPHVIADAQAAIDAARAGKGAT